MNEKRNTESNAPKNRTSQANKRRKREVSHSPPAEGSLLENGADGKPGSTVAKGSAAILAVEGRGSSPAAEKPSKIIPAPGGESTHVRFGSEEPRPIRNKLAESTTGTRLDQEAPEESDDDEAPEALDNSAQLQKIKAASQREEQARQRFVQT
jgi:U3 small nucleolar RNA-associated protein 16